LKRSIRLFARTLRSAFVPQVCAVLLLSTSPFLLAQAQGGATTAPAQGTGEAAPAMQVRDLRQLAPTNQVPGQPATGDQGNSEYVYGRTMPVMTPALTHPQTEFQQMVFSSTGRKLPIFGADLFGDVPSTFAPVDNIPVTPDYVIGPGDELRLQIWGQVNQNGSYIVDRTGLIYLPSVGPIHVAGIPFSQLRDFLKTQLSRVYRNYDLNVNMGQLRSIQVFVVGQASKPGSYTIGSQSTLLNALFASGGPLPQGSVRDIQVRRGGQVVTHFDLYDLLLHGDKSKDVRLESGDVIFIPGVGPEVAVLGSVITPAIYELHGETSFDQVIALAGGKTSIAAGSVVRIERISEHTDRSVMNLDLSSAEVKSTPAQDGDIVTVSPIINRYKNAVTLRGNVANAGRYAWFEGMRISDLIPNRDALITRNYYEKTNQLGQSNTDYRGPMAEGALGIAASSDHADQPRTSSMNDSDNATQPQNSTANNSGGTPTGTAGTPQKGAPANSSSSVGEALTAHDNRFTAKTDVILQAPDIDWNYAVIERQDAKTLTTSLIPFNLGNVILSQSDAQNLELLPGDIVTIFSKADIRVPSTQQTRFVRLEGEFPGAGVYSVLPGETLRQLVVRAGGLTPDAYLYASEFTRLSTQRLQKQRLQDYANSLQAQISLQTASSVAGAISSQDTTAAQTDADIANSIVARLRQAEPSGRIVLDLKPNSEGVAALPDLVLEDGDRFVVPKMPSNVNVEGQVYNANAFVWQRGKRVKNYLEMAGGPDRSADRRRAYVVRADGSVLSSQYSSFSRALMFPGDTIVVPPVIQRSNFIRELGNIATIMAGFGVTAAAIEVLK